MMPSSTDGYGWGNVTFSIAPPSGYYLSSVFMPGNIWFYHGEIEAIFGFENYFTPGPTETIAYDPYQWIDDLPLSGTAWQYGYSVQYSLAWIYADNSTSSPIECCDPITSGLYAQPTLLLPNSSDPNVTGRRIFRLFGWTNSVVESIMDLDNTADRWSDETPSTPPS